MEFEQTVSEGFICPQCKYDLGSVELLHLHFNTVHAQPEISKAQGFTDKLQRHLQRLIGEEEGPAEAKNPPLPTAQAPVWNNPVRSTPAIDTLQINGSYFLGKKRSHTREFRKLRQLRLNDCNIKLSRLEKLCDPHAPSNYEMRRVYEKQVVGWTDDELVGNCPECGTRFGVSLPLLHSDGPDVRGRHHCRLCGYVFCSDCCVFLTISEARRIVRRELEQHRGLEEPPPPVVTDHERSSARGQGGSWLHRFRRPSHDSANGNANIKVECDPRTPLRFREPSVTLTGGLDPRLLLPKKYSSSDDIELRLCFFCRDLLQSRWNFLQERQDPNFPLEYYNEIRNLFREIQPELVSYNAMADSIYSGETKYVMEDVKGKRAELKVKFDKLAQLGKDLELAGMDEESDQAGPRSALSRRYQLCRAVHNHVRHFLQEHMIPLRSLPSLDQYERLKKQRETLLRRRQEEQAAHMQQLKQLQMEKERTSQDQMRTFSPAKTASGFVPRGNRSGNPFESEMNTVVGSCDSKELMRMALEQQIDNVRNFLQQARDMGRVEEVKTLQENLHDLKMELNRLGSLSS